MKRAGQNDYRAVRCGDTDFRVQECGTPASFGCFLESPSFFGHTYQNNIGLELSCFHDAGMFAEHGIGNRFTGLVSPHHPNAPRELCHSAGGDSMTGARLPSGLWVPVGSRENYYGGQTTVSATLFPGGVTLEAVFGMSAWGSTCLNTSNTLTAQVCNRCCSPETCEWREYAAALRMQGAAPFGWVLGSAAACEQEAYTPGAVSAHVSQILLHNIWTARLIVTISGVTAAEWALAMAELAALAPSVTFGEYYDANTQQTLLMEILRDRPKTVALQIDGPDIDVSGLVSSTTGPSFGRQVWTPLSGWHFQGNTSGAVSGWGVEPVPQYYIESGQYAYGYTASGWSGDATCLNAGTNASEEDEPGSLSIRVAFVWPARET